MTEFLKLKDIVDIIPLLLDYIAPGFVFLTMRSLTFSKDYTKDKYVIIKAIVISFIFKETIYPLLSIIQKYLAFNNDIKRAVFILISTTISALYIRFGLENKILKVLGNGITTDEDYLSNIIDNKKGAWVRVYLNEEKVIYVGKISYFDDMKLNEDRRVALACFSSYSFKSEILEDNTSNENAIVLISIKNIRRIEIFR